MLIVGDCWGAVTTAKGPWRGVVPHPMLQSMFCLYIATVLIYCPSLLNAYSALLL